jgi:hypothetical protein
MYFQKFPLISYDVRKNGEILIASHILRRSKFIENIKNNTSLFFQYNVQDSDRPEIIADKIYGSVEYYWIVLHFNDIINPFDWVLSSEELNQYVNKKYSNPNSIHHYETTDKHTVNSNYPGAVAVSNFTYESKINESKRRIKLLDPSYVSQVEQEFNLIMSKKVDE